MYSPGIPVVNNSCTSKAADLNNHSGFKNPVVLDKNGKCLNIHDAVNCRVRLKNEYGTEKFVPVSAFKGVESSSSCDHEEYKSFTDHCQ
jgi:hypothetical protein